jgi:predicted DNA-binding transcriptional regulator AlpA
MTRFLTPKAVCAQVALSRATLDRIVASGDFPKPIRITQRRLAFNAEAVEQWMAERMEAA